MKVKTFMESNRYKLDDAINSFIGDDKTLIDVRISALEETKRTNGCIIAVILFKDKENE